MAKILLVDDEPSILNVLGTLMKSEGHEVVPVRQSDKALDLLKADYFDLMISDMRMTPLDGMELLRLARKERPGLAVIMLTAYGSVETAVTAMREGAFDYVTKPFKVDELQISVRRALQYQHVLKENVELKAQLQSQGQTKFDNMVAVSAPMRQICAMIERVAPTDSTVLILGESGTGKEVVAKAIHAQSLRKTKNFLPINCAAMPEPLLESELFGHVKGSFTGASSTKDGLFEAASGGTIFLDEIGAMPLNLQAKLLRVLQDRTVRKVGGTETKSVDVRVLAATNDQLERLIKEGKFREDLYYRLSVIPIEIPPLRNRTDDIMPLVDFFIRKIMGPNATLPTVEPDAALLIETYRWPGNVRELENAIRHAITFARDGRITRDVLPARMQTAAEPDTAATAHGRTLASPGIIDVRNYLGKSLRGFLRTMEREYVAAALEQNGGDKVATAKALKISLAGLYRKVPVSED